MYCLPRASKDIVPSVSFTGTKVSRTACSSCSHVENGMLSRVTSRRWILSIISAIVCRSRSAWGLRTKSATIDPARVAIPLHWEAGGFYLCYSLR
eukprot:symbB.v1.2.040101.t1/scaffold6990.1/size14023/1